MLLTDVASVVLDPAVSVEGLVARGGDADVVWFVDTPRDACADAATFAKTVNTGAVLMRASAFTANLLTHNVLALARDKNNTELGRPTISSEPRIERGTVRSARSPLYSKISRKSEIRSPYGPRFDRILGIFCF